MKRPEEAGEEPTVGAFTLGCKVNQYDTQGILESFRQRGYRISRFEDAPDVAIINTCTVTGSGARKSRQMIRRAVRDNPGSVVVVTGCYSQVFAEEVARIDGVAVITGTSNRRRVVDLVEKAMDSQEWPLVDVSALRGKGADEDAPFEPMPMIHDFGGRTRVTVKIQEGCNQFCTYCIIPYARGPVRSRPLNEVLRELKVLVEKEGFREVVLAGIHLGAYGTDIDGTHKLPELIREMHHLDGLERIRVSSIEPTEVSHDLIETIAGWPKVCRHLHIPLQSGSERILNRMRRPYSAQDYLGLVSAVKEAVPEIAITTDALVGFPGERDEDFKSTLEVAEQSGFARMHIFRYSPRKGTPAAKFKGKVPGAVKRQRGEELSQLAEGLKTNFYRGFVGKTMDILVETCAEGSRGRPALLDGLTDNYIRVYFEGPEDLRNELVRARIQAVLREDDGLKGTLDLGPLAEGIKAGQKNTLQ